MQRVSMPFFFLLTWQYIKVTACKEKEKAYNIVLKQMKKYKNRAINTFF